MLVKNVNEIIDSLEALNPNDEYCYEKAILAYSKLINFPVILFEEKVNMPVFRTRTHVDIDFFEKISQISLPPKDAINYFARCNRPGQNVFYCSENRPISYFELIENWIETKNVGDVFRVTIGRWMIKSQMSSIIVTFPDMDSRISEYDKYYGAVYDDLVKDQEQDLKEANHTFFRYLANKFRLPAKRDLKTYIITTAYCNLALLHAKGKAHAICYPSVPSKQIGVNWAISSTFITPDNIELTNALCDEFQVYKNEIGKFDFRQIGNIEAHHISIQDNILNWSN
ncbi:MAG TPA: hypothetical protein PKZ75_09170 [Bacteroidia bacterium]|nr:hypothetical protein [Bacteroidia bacterium]